MVNGNDGNMVWGEALKVGDGWKEVERRKFVVLGRIGVEVDKVVNIRID
ncbi:hypothetical protein [Paenibacillus xylanexedens]|nr:hypothetical protein [Paenibacillus xylanexedens]